MNSGFARRKPAWAGWQKSWSKGRLSGWSWALWRFVVGHATVFADVPNNATIACEEIFGPVLSVIPYRDENEAVRIANDSDYGLGGSVWVSGRELSPETLAAYQQIKTT